MKLEFSHILNLTYYLINYYYYFNNKDSGKSPDLMI